MTQRASLQEVLDFANAVRKAGGGNPLDALMPAVPEDTEACLIAKNLNFNCEVDTPEGMDGWVMVVKDEALAYRIADSLSLRVVKKAQGETRYANYGNTDEEWYVVLPPEIGQVAADFDEAGEIYGTYRYYRQEFGEQRAKEKLEAYYSPDQLKLLLEMQPYIEVAEEEAYDLATVINPDGSIIL